MSEEKFGYMDIRKIDRVVNALKRYIEIVEEYDSIVKEIKESTDIVIPELEAIAKLDVNVATGEGGKDEQ